MTPDELATTILDGVAQAVAAGELSAPVPTEVTVERPRVREHGDYATNIAMRLAKPAGKPPREVAEQVAARLRERAGIRTVEVAGPGFLNITLAEGALGELASTIVAAGSSYGRSEVLAGQRLNLEYVPASPTGPLHVGSARWATVGDALARLLEACGAEVVREYYVNDDGGGALVRMSERAGTMVTLDDLVEAVGVDAGRYALVRTSMDSAIDLDVDLWSRRTSDNPVFSVQDAHARLASLLRNAADLGIGLGDPSTVDFTLLGAEREGDLLRALGEFPRVVLTAAELRGPHRVARYAEELAGTYHRFYDSCRVLPQGDEPATALTVARLWLCAATQTVLANALRLLGVSAPDRM